MATFTLPSGEVVLVDDEDLERIMTRRWYIMRSNPMSGRGRSCYVQSDGGVLLHRFLTGLEKGDRRTVDHINGDGLDNRRFNLDVVSQSENNRRARERYAVRGVA